MTLSQFSKKTEAFYTDQSMTLSTAWYIQPHPKFEICRVGCMYTELFYAITPDLFLCFYFCCSAIPIHLITFYLFFFGLGVVNEFMVIGWYVKILLNYWNGAPDYCNGILENVLCNAYSLAVVCMNHVSDIL